MERLIIGLPEGAVAALGPSNDSKLYPLPKEAKLFVCPLAEQDLDSGSIVLELKDGVVSERVYFPIKEGRKEQLKKALGDFEKSDRGNHRVLNYNQQLEILGSIEFSVYGAEILGPDSLMPF